MGYTQQSKQMPLRKLLLARADLIAGMDEKEVSRRRRVPRHLMNMLPLMETVFPVSYCPTCCGRVVKPCRKCAVDRSRRGRS